MSEVEITPLAHENAALRRQVLDLERELAEAKADLESAGADLAASEAATRDTIAMLSDEIAAIRNGFATLEALAAKHGTTPDQAIDLATELDRLTWRQPTPEQIAAMARVGDAVRELAAAIVRHVPRGRERALAMTALQDARMRANAGIMLDAPRPR